MMLLGMTEGCHTGPCQHGGTCAPDGSGYTCQCATGYTGNICETGNVFKQKPKSRIL